MQVPISPRSSASWIARSPAIPADAVRVRPATAADLAAAQAIYAHAVSTGLASFEEVPPALEEMRRRFEDVAAQGLPYLAADVGGRLAGYGYCTLYRTRSAYRYSLEDSIYVDKDFHGRGIGRALLAELIARCEGLG